MRSYPACYLGFALLFFGIACAPAPQTPKLETTTNGITPEPIPPGFDFPANRAALQKLVNDNDVAAMRTHAWKVWAGMTTASTSSLPPGNTLPVWETWLASGQTFTSPPTERPGPQTTPPREFVAPSQSSHLGLPVPAEENLVVGFNKFDPEMVAYLWAAHPGPGSPPDYFYTSKTSLTSLNDAWPPNTPIIDRKVTDAPARAMEIKPVMLWVDSQQLTALLFWQGPTASTDTNCTGLTIPQILDTSNFAQVENCHPSPNTWTHCVLIDPTVTTTSLVAATQAQFNSAIKSQAPGCTDFNNALYGGLNMLYNFPMSAAEAADFNKLQGGSASAGDFAVLMAMHINTKEIIDWTWQTFWWQGDRNPPQNYPGSRDGMTSNVNTPWSYYAMCTAYSQTTQPNNMGTMRVCFNPFLETSKGIPDGVQSNCVSCHGTATASGGVGYPANYSQPIDFGGSSFQGHTRTDFSWAIPVKAK